MSRRDEITGKGPLSGNCRSHAENHSRRTWNANLQTVEVKVAPNKTQKMKVSARTMKTLRKQNKLA